MAVSIIMIIVGIIGLVWFGMPFYTYGIMNIGNATGLMISIVLILIGIFRKPFIKMLKYLCKHAAGKTVLLLAVLAVCAVVVLVITESCFMAGAALDKPDNKSATIVVLGCKVVGTQPSMMLEERLEAAYKYLNDNPEAVCILSGGQGEDEEISESRCMYNYLVDRGINADRLIMEEKSTSTRENLQFSSEIIKSRGLNEEIILITNEFHLYRAGKVADSLGLSHKSVPADTNIWLFPTYYVRELYGILYEWVF